MAAETSYRHQPLGLKCRKQRSGFFWTIGLLVLVLLATPANAASVRFRDCRDEIPGVPTGFVRFEPKFANASFTFEDGVHTLSVKVHGNVTGRYNDVVLPPPDSTQWDDDNEPEGKIQDLPAPGTKYTTIINKINLLSYEPWSKHERFCQMLDDAECPLGPAFFANKSDPTTFPSFTMRALLNESYRFTTVTSRFQIIHGDDRRTTIGCIDVEVTPSLGRKISGMLSFLPLGILILVGIGTISAAVFSPWGTTNVFKWTTNYGRQADLLRLVTPGFADCLNYLQFIVLTGGLTLSYPGFYQPVVSKVAWSALLFNQSFVSHENGTQSLKDGVYSTTGKYGLDHITQHAGISRVSDAWAGMVIWLLVMLAAVIAIIQIGFFLQWIRHRFSHTQEEDLRAKNIPFTVGNVVRFVFIYFLLPIVSISMFQFVEAEQSGVTVVACAGVLLVLVLVFAGWLLKVFVTTKPRSVLFDDLTTLLLYGSLYNTYSDHAALFALLPVMLTFIRGVAIGAVQPSGIAQIVLLAICEVLTILTLHTFRPFHSPTSMNAYHTLFAAVRFSSILLMVTFAPSLGISEGTKSWIGYAILLLHAIVLVFGFFLNALQKIIEVAARLAGVGVDKDTGFAKVLGMRQLSRRHSRNKGHLSRASQSSAAGMLSGKPTSLGDGHHLRNQSATSTQILLDNARPIDRNSNASFAPNNVDSNSAYTPTTAGPGSTFSFPSDQHHKPGIFGLATTESGQRYYRAPRIRRPTMEPLSPGAMSRGSFSSVDWTRRGSQTPSVFGADALEGPSISGRATPVDALPKSPPRNTTGDVGLAQMPSNEQRASHIDYSTREVDFYYGVRGPALNSNVPSRKLRTGPVDPTNPVMTASGWFKSLLGGKTKDKGRGFEVIRSNRMPPSMMNPGTESPPEGVPVVAAGAVRRDLDNDEPTNTEPLKEAQAKQARAETPIKHEKSESIEMTRIRESPPRLSLRIDTGNGDGSSERRPAMMAPISDDDDLVDLPIPRKSSRRKSSATGSRPSTGTSGKLVEVKSNDYFSTQRQPTKQLETPLISITDEPSPSPSALDSHVRDDRPKSVGNVQNFNVLLTDQSLNPEFDGRSVEIDEVSRTSADSRQSK